jgi:hypothetical protein
VILTLSIAAVLLFVGVMILIDASGVWRNP